jgi:hypothetical protein
MAVLQERVDRLEEALMRLLYIQQKTEMELQSFKQEMKVFKDEMQEYKEWSKKNIESLSSEMKEFKEWSQKNIESLGAETKAFKEEMQEYKEWSKKNIESLSSEMKEFKEEMKEFKKWAKESIENLNRQWGSLAQKMGTLVEDIFAPSIDKAIERYFGMSPDIIDTRKYIRKEGRSTEFDILALCEKDKKAYLVEVKANPDKKEYIEDFLQKLNEAPFFFPILREYTLMGIYAALNIKEETVTFLTRKKLYAMIFRGDVLEIVNFEALKA